MVEFGRKLMAIKFSFFFNNSWPKLNWIESNSNKEISMKKMKENRVNYIETGCSVIAYFLPGSDW